MHRTIIAISSLTLLSFLAVRPAQAGLAIGAATEVGVPVGDNTDGLKKAAIGFEGRLGYKFDLSILYLAPELTLGFTSFKGESDIYSFKMGQFGAGARLGVGKLIMPYAYAHIGYGWAKDADWGGMTIDGGAGVDLSLKIIKIGIHIGYNRLKDKDLDASFGWMEFGLHAYLEL